MNKLISLSTSFFAILVSMLAAGVSIYSTFFGDYPVLINSSPSATEIYLDDKKIGNTPLSYNFKRGTYNIVAKKENYEVLEHIIYVNSKSKDINLQLVPKRTTLVKNEKTIKEVKTVPKVETLVKEINNLKSIILLDPKEAISVSILKEKVLSQAQLLNALKEEVRDVKEQGKWYVGTMIAIIIGLLGIIVTLFNTNKSK